MTPRWEEVLFRCKKGGKEERDRRRQLVNLLTALSYCVGDS